jgi:hypothetical protein
VRDVGPLEWDEMYGFEPALALGALANRILFGASS